MNKPITLEKMTAYMDATWKKCQSEAWGEPVAHCTLEQLAWLQRVVPSTGTIALYTAPPQRKPLSDDEIQAIWKKTFESGSSINTFVRVIEAAHNIKE